MGLFFCWDHGYRELVCESDNMNIVNLLLEVHELLGRNWSFTLSSISRLDVNGVADTLARWGT